MPKKVLRKAKEVVLIPDLPRKIKQDGQERIDVYVENDGGIVYISRGSGPDTRLTYREYVSLGRPKQLRYKFTEEIRSG